MTMATSTRIFLTKFTIDAYAVPARTTYRSSPHGGAFTAGSPTPPLRRPWVSNSNLPGRNPDATSRSSTIREPGVFEYATRLLFLKGFRLILLPNPPINADIFPGEYYDRPISHSYAEE